ncbi:MAG: aminopeptidase [Clostridia bacterium]|nr:aminopeptidase [Clostridia bacterium]MBO5298657.1 aminopeptidase [Clostridia bacterium]
MSDLSYQNKNAFDVLSETELKEVQEYCEGYKKFLDNGKTERFCVSYAVSLAEKEGFVPFVDGKKYNPGDKVYHVQKNHAAIFAVIGSESPEKGFNITAAHVDAPRLDLKPSPLYEDNGMAYFKTHYYGGVRKYQWVTRPLALCGVVCKKDGTSVNINIGSDPEDPIFMITDLLPHLAKDQSQKPLAGAFAGESLNILLGSEPEKNEEKDKIRENVLKALNQKYGITEADLLTAEITVVPAENARDLGFDRSLISAYGHDDRVCAYPCFTALLKTTAPKKTCVCVFADKEEIGSVGISGLRSDYMTNFLLALCDGYNSRVAFANSAAISSDVAAAFDPNYPEVFERRNSAFINCGPAICKYTGHGGKSGASDACPEFIAKLLGIFDEANVIYQFTELGKVDQGGGGTVSQFIADRNIEVIDIGVAMLCMHAPCEVAAKTDIYMLDRLCEAFYKNY